MQCRDRKSSLSSLPTWRMPRPVEYSSSLSAALRLRSSFFLAMLVAIIAFTAARAKSQQATSQDKQAQGQQSGMSTGVARAPVKDAKNRPITAGGFVDGAPVVFID